MSIKSNRSINQISSGELIKIHQLYLNCFQILMIHFHPERNKMGKYDFNNSKKNHNLVLRRARILILFSIANKQQRQQCVSLRRNQHVHEPFGQSSLLIIINNSLMMMVKNLLKKTDPTNVWTMLCTILFVVILVSNTQWQLATATTKDIIISLMYVYHSFFSLYLQHHNIINHIEL